MVHKRKRWGAKGFSVFKDDEHGIQLEVDRKDKTVTIYRTFETFFEAIASPEKRGKVIEFKTQKEIDKFLEKTSPAKAVRLYKKL